MNVLIIGANGKIGRQVAKKMASAADFQPTAFIRKKEQKAHFDSIEVPTLLENLEHAQEQLAKAIKGFDAVVFTAGSGGSTDYDKTLEIDLYGAIKCINAAQNNDIKHFVMVSAAFADEPEVWEAAGIRPYYIAKHLADKELIRSDLNYSILRPVRLTDEPEAKIKIAADPHKLSEEIPRATVAEAILQVLKGDTSKKQILEMSEGDQEVKAAVQHFE